jgi:predicted dehydrogenase
MSALAERSVALIGWSAPARAYLDVMDVFPELVLQAWVEAPPTAVPPAVRTFASLDDMLRSGCVPDLAIVCTPPAEHAAHSEPLLRASVDVLVDAPLATTVDDADRISALGEHSGRLAVTASPFRLLPCLEAVRQQLEQGAIGRLCSLEITLSHKRDAREGWRADPELSGGGVWMDLGPHALDLAETLAGPIECIRMLDSEHVQRADVEDHTLAETRHSGGLAAAIRTSWNEQSGQPLVRCIGDTGELWIGQAQTVLRSASGEESVIASGYDEREARARVLEHFLRLARGPENAHADHGAQAVAWLHAAYRSVRDGRFELA